MLPRIYLNAEVATEHRVVSHLFNSSDPNQVKALQEAHPCGTAPSKKRIGLRRSISGARQKWMKSVNWEAPDRMSFLFGRGLRAGRQSSRRPCTISPSCFRGALNFKSSFCDLLEPVHDRGCMVAYVARSSEVVLADVFSVFCMLETDGTRNWASCAHRAYLKSACAPRPYSEALDKPDHQTVLCRQVRALVQEVAATLDSRGRAEGFARVATTIDFATGAVVELETFGFAPFRFPGDCTQPTIQKV